MRASAADEAYAIDITHSVCKIAGPKSLIKSARSDLRKHGVLSAVRNHDTEKLYRWLMMVFSYQGISNRAVYVYLEKHGQIKFNEVGEGFLSNRICPKLNSYWNFEDCGYQKSKQTCRFSKLLKSCPLPKHNLRNGRLNQTAYSLFLFIRDVAGGDLIEWIDQQVAERDPSTSMNVLQERLLAPMRNIYGVSDKVLTMTLATLLIGARAEKPEWFRVGCGMIAIDRLVHNFLHRTGIFRRFGAPHLYGPQCYAPGFCADVLDYLARKIDAQKFDESYPAYFPRFIQNSIWRFCGQTECNICNGTQIKDRRRCANTECPVHVKCDRDVLLKRPTKFHGNKKYTLRRKTK